MADRFSFPSKTVEITADRFPLPMGEFVQRGPKAQNDAIYALLLAIWEKLEER